MIEKDLSRLRFLHTRCMKGERLYSEDVDFVQRIKEKIVLILESIDDISERLKND
jgi:hypothetical protein